MKRVPKRTTVDMSTKLGRLEFSSPVFTASGCAAAGKELDQFIDITTIGAVVTKSYSSHGRNSQWNVKRNWITRTRH
jgi:dihydroorotate dehydrogenase (NAD+) catalytic subunit